jgi:DNA-directed RNA polymerase subunit E'/Rpb7
MLDENVIEHLRKKIHTDLIGHSDREHGCIVKIYNNLKVLGNTVSNTGPGVYFHVRFGARVIKPEVGDVYSGRIILVVSNGIFVEVTDTIRPLVPLWHLEQLGYQYESTTGNTPLSTNSLFVSSKKEPLTLGKTVTIKITNVEYNGKIFSCAAELHE